MKVGEKIGEYLREEGLKQTWLSKKTNISLPKLNLALSGKRRLNFEEYEIICYVLGVGADKFITPKPPLKVCRVASIKKC